MSILLQARQRQTNGRVAAHSQCGKVHGEGQAHGEQCKEPCWKGNGCEGDQPKEEARDDAKDEQDRPAEGSEHSRDAISAAVWEALGSLVGGCGGRKAHDRRKAAHDSICQGMRSIRLGRRIHGAGPARDNASYVRKLVSIVSYCSRDWRIALWGWEEDRERAGHAAYD
jgi:hypothetical protein